MFDAKLIFKGMIIGLAKIIPGVSGSLLAVSLGIYNIAVTVISHPFKDFRNNIIFLLNVGLGIIFSITLFSNIVSFFLSKYFFLTVTLFVGFIIGTFPELIKETDIRTKEDIVIVFLITTFVFLLSCFKNYDIYIYQSNFINNLYVLFLGFLDAATMIIPGISGTAIFLLLGSYSFILELFSSISNFSFSSYIVPFIFFGTGLFVGIILVSKIMNYVLRYKKRESYLFILGFALSSVFLLCREIFSMNVSYFEFILGFLLLIIGYKISLRLNV